MKIIFLIDSVFSKRDYDRYGFEYFQKNAVDVQLWDLRYLLEKTINLEGFEKDVDNHSILRRIFEKNSELENIDRLDGCFLIDQRMNVYKKYSTCWFRDKGATIIRLRYGLIPIHVYKPSLLDYAMLTRNKILTFGFKKAIDSILNTLARFFYKKSKINQCVDITVCAGSGSKSDSKEFKIESHSLDYDLFLKLNNLNIYSDEKYIVFIDNGIIDHPEFHLSEDYIADSKAEIYYPLIVKFFDVIEKIYGMQVVVAMHPRIQNNKSSQQYGGRRVVSHKTAELIQSSKLVLAHDSTAINFAVLWRIPLIIITTNDIEKGMRYRSMQALTASLKIKRININNRYNKLDFHKISNMPIYQYENYINSFIKTDGCRMTDLNSFEIFINGLIKYSKLKRK